MSTRRAACSCGQLRLEADGDPLRISVCHCLDCQRRTGSVFGAQARFPRESVRIAGRSQEYQRQADSGQLVHFHFCPDCGATVHYWLEDHPEQLAVPVGAFADPGFPAPTVSVYGERRHGWVRLPDGCEQQA